MSVFENVYGGNDIDYEENLKVKKKEKKQKEVRNKLFLGLKKKRNRKPKSQIQELIDKISQKKLTDFYDIKSFLQTDQGLSLQDNTLKFLKSVASAKVVNGKFTVSDTFANKPIIYKVVSKEFLSKFMTNDSLWIASKFREVYDGTNYECLPFDKKFYVKSAVVVSPPFLYNGSIERGFIQDNNSNFFSINMSDVKAEVANKIFELKTNPQIFYYKGDKYIKSGNESACVIVNETQSGNVRKLFDNQRKFGIDLIKKSGIDARTIEVKNKPRYIYTKIISDDFCPAFLNIKESNILLKMLFNVVFDYNSLFQRIIDYSVNKDGAIVFPNDFIYWENLPLIMDLFLSLTVAGSSFGLPAKAKDLLSGICKEYFLIKDALDVWGIVMLDIERICVDFFNCFNNRIQYDKIKELRKKMVNLKEEHVKLLNDESLKDVETFLKNTIGGWCLCLKNQMNHTIIKSLIDKILSTTLEIETNNFREIDNVESVANIIYNVTYSYRNNDIVLFPVLLSPGAFFGNKLGNKDERIKMYQEILKDYSEKRKVDEIKEIDTNAFLKDILLNIGTYKAKIVDGNIQRFLTSKKTVLESNGINTGTVYNQMRNVADSEAMNNADFSNLLTDLVIKNKDNLGKLDEVNIPNMYLTNWYTNTAGKMLNDKQKKTIETKIKKLEKERILINNQEQINQDDPNYMSEDDTIIEASSYATKNIPIYLGGKQVQDPQLRKKIADYYVDLLMASGIYGEAMQGDVFTAKLRELEPEELMQMYPIAPAAFSLVRRATQMPTLGQVLRGKEITYSIPQNNDMMYLRGLNANLLFNGINDKNVDLNAFSVNEQVTKKTIQNTQNNVRANQKVGKYFGLNSGNDEEMVDVSNEDTTEKTTLLKSNAPPQKLSKKQRKMIDMAKKGTLFQTNIQATNPFQQRPDDQNYFG